MNRVPLLWLWLCCGISLVIPTVQAQPNVKNSISQLPDSVDYIHLYNYHILNFREEFDSAKVYRWKLGKPQGDRITLTRMEQKGKKKIALTLKYYEGNNPLLLNQLATTNRCDSAVIVNLDLSKVKSIKDSLSLRFSILFSLVADSVTLRQPDFHYTTLKGAVFSNATLDRANFTFATLDRANFTLATLDMVNFSRATLDRANFTFATLDRANFTLATLDGVKFSYATLNAIFFGATLDRVNFSSTTLNRTAFSDATLNRVVFSRATLNRVVFSRATLENVAFLNAKIKSPSFESAKIVNRFTFQSDSTDSSWDFKSTYFEDDAIVSFENAEKYNYFDIRLEDLNRTWIDSLVAQKNFPQKPTSNKTAQYSDSLESPQKQINNFRQRENTPDSIKIRKERRIDRLRDISDVVKYVNQQQNYPSALKDDVLARLEYQKTRIEMEYAEGIDWAWLNLMEILVRNGYEGAGKFFIAVSLINAFFIVIYIFFAIEIHTFIKERPLTEITPRSNWKKIMALLSSRQFPVDVKSPNRYVKKLWLIGLGFFELFWFSAFIFVTPKFSREYFQFTPWLRGIVIVEWLIGSFMLAIYIIYIASRYAFVKALLGI